MSIKKGVAVQIDSKVIDCPLESWVDLDSVMDLIKQIRDSGEKIIDVKGYAFDVFVSGAEKHKEFFK